MTDLEKNKNAHETSKAVKIIESPSGLDMGYQRKLFPVDIIETSPSNQGTVDLKLIGSGRNGKDYAIKRVCDGNGMIPASELFCYELARQVNIATPEFDIVLLKGGECAFGSVWEGGVYDLSAINIISDLLTKGNPNSIDVKLLDKFFSKIYAFDLFINNTDRHFRNYIFRKSYNNNYIALAFDHSKAWCSIDYKGLQALDSGCNTQLTIDYIKRYKKFDRQQAIDTLSELGQIKELTVKNILSEMPKEWMTKEQSSEIIKWWSSKEFKDRLLVLEKEVANVVV